MFPITFVTTCKGRLHHVKQTLPVIVAADPGEVILVDYGCPDNTGDWVEANLPSVKVIRVTDDPGFCLPRARNTGAAHATSTWICFIDADIIVQDGWLEWMQENLQPHHFYRADPGEGLANLETYGTVICSREDFNAVNGYDEVFRGWGGEDDDLYHRLSFLNANAQKRYPNHFVEAISHDDAERTVFHSIKNVKTQSFINDCYMRVKEYLRSQGVHDIPFETRQQLFNSLSDTLKQYATRPKLFSTQVKADNLTNIDGEHLDLLLEVARRRRYGLFGTRYTSVRTLKQTTAEA